MKSEAELFIEAESYAKQEKEKRLFGQRVSRCISTEEFQTEGYIAGFIKCQQEYEEKLQKFIEIPDECICSCKNIEKLELVYPLPPICNNCRKMIRRSFYNAT